MPFRDDFLRQVELLVRVLPLVAQEEIFGLKGGTAINMFLRNMPRLSIDIDLAYLPIHDRPESLAEIDAGLKRIGERVVKAIPSAKITPVSKEDNDVRFYVRASGVQIIVEANTVIRGTVFGVEARQVSKRVEEEFGFAEIQVLSTSDLYGGKMMAALARQHPRDLFDVRLLLADGITAGMRAAFIVYLISHNRPMWEVLNARRKDITQLYQTAFAGMTEENVSQSELENAREDFIAEIVGKMPNEHRQFLVSFEKGEPEWKLLGLPGIEKMPAVLWRQQNLDTLTKEQRRGLVENLSRVLGV